MDWLYRQNMAPMEHTHPWQTQLEQSCTWTGGWPEITLVLTTLSDGPLSGRSSENLDLLPLWTEQQCWPILMLPEMRIPLNALQNKSDHYFAGLPGHYYLFTYQQCSWISFSTEFPRQIFNTYMHDRHKWVYCHTSSCHQCNLSLALGGPYDVLKISVILCLIPSCPFTFTWSSSVSWLTPNPNSTSSTPSSSLSSACYLFVPLFFLIAFSRGLWSACFAWSLVH